MILLALILQAAPPPGSPSPPALQAGPGQPPATMVVEPVAMAMAAWDADGDGRTSRAELQAGVARSMAAINAARSGGLGYIGYADWAKRWLGDANALPSPFEIDADGDNRITLAELQAAMTRVFDRLDKDRDDFVTRAEALTIRASPSERDGRGGPRGKRRR